jgi:hypothetical protein
LTQTVHIAYDDVTLSLIPPDAPCVIAYVDGIYANYDAAVARFGAAKVRGITVTGQHGEHIYWCDSENGDLTGPQAVAWVQHEVNVLHHTDRGPYAQVSSMQAIIDALDAAGVKRDSYPVWTAHYAGEHICGPRTCAYPGFTQAADGTQFTETAHGKSLDESLVTDRWLAITPIPAAPKQPKGKWRAMLTLDQATGKWTVRPVPSITARRGDVSRWSSAEVQANQKTGRWRARGIPFNSKPLGD